ncbi:unnamed protein product, partial [Symbiodinium sp. KB8]
NGKGLKGKHDSFSHAEEYFSDAAHLESAFQDTAITQADAYFNLGAFGFDDGKRVGIFQRTEQFSDIVRFLNSFLLLRFPGERWVLTAYTCRGLVSASAEQKVAPRSAMTSCFPANTGSPGFFLDICCGANAPLSESLRKSGIQCVCVDALGSEPFDLLNDRTYDSLLRLAFSGIVRMAHVSQKLMYRSVCILRAVFASGAGYAFCDPSLLGTCSHKGQHQSVIGTRDEQ